MFSLVFLILANHLPPYFVPNGMNVSLMCLYMEHSAQDCYGISWNFRTRMGQD